MRGNYWFGGGLCSLYLFSYLFGVLQTANGGWLITSANDFYSSISSKTSNKLHLLHMSITTRAGKSITQYNREEDETDAIAKAKITKTEQEHKSASVWWRIVVAEI